MMKTATMVAALIGGASVLTAMLGGCSNSATEVNYPVRPPEMEDCKIYRLTNDAGEEVTVARCQNSTTTTNSRSGRRAVAAIVVDGVEYVRREQ